VDDAVYCATMGAVAQATAADRSIVSNNRIPYICLVHVIDLTVSISVPRTRKLCYRKDDRAMRLIKLLPVSILTT